jgi:hypothetical protein
LYSSRSKSSTFLAISLPLFIALFGEGVHLILVGEIQCFKFQGEKCAYSRIKFIDSIVQSPFIPVMKKPDVCTRFFFAPKSTVSVAGGQILPAGSWWHRTMGGH